MLNFKNILLCGILFLCAFRMQAQTYTYTFSHFTSTYTPLASGTNVYGTSPWNSNSVVTLPMGFNFNFMGDIDDSIDFVPGIFGLPVGEDYEGFYAFYAELSDTGRLISKSPVTYSTTGSVGNRIFKVQCATAGFEVEEHTYGSYSSVVSFQTWFYESDNSIEVHMGPSTIIHPLACYFDSANPGPVIGVIGYDTAITAVDYSLLLAGSASTPTTANWNINLDPPTLSSTPPNGKVYRFGQLYNGLDEAEQVFGDFGIFPNPSNEIATVMYSVKIPGEVKLIFSDMQGRIVNESAQTKAVGTYRYELNTSGFFPGIYFVSLVSGEQKITRKISVTH